MGFSELYNRLILELNSDEVKLASKLNQDKNLFNFDPFNKVERVIVKDGISISSDILNNMHSSGKAIINPLIKKLAKGVFKSDDLDVVGGDIIFSISTNMGLKKRVISIGSFLSKLKDQKCYIVISRNRHDIIGMSIDKNWTSCLNRDGCNYDKSYSEVKNGGLVAYLIYGNSADMNEVMNDHSSGGLFQSSCLARISLKRFIGRDKSGFIFIPDERIYYTIGFFRDIKTGIFKNSLINEFTKIVNDYCSNVINVQTVKNDITFDRGNEYLDHSLSNKSTVYRIRKDGILDKLMNDISYLCNIPSDKIDDFINRNSDIISRLFENDIKSIDKVKDCESFIKLINMFSDSISNNPLYMYEFDDDSSKSKANAKFSSLFYQLSNYKFDVDIRPYILNMIKALDVDKLTKLFSNDKMYMQFYSVISEMNGVDRVKFLKFVADNFPFFIHLIYGLIKKRDNSLIELVYGDGDISDVIKSRLKKNMHIFLEVYKKNKSKYLGTLISKLNM